MNVKKLSLICGTYALCVSSCSGYGRIECRLDIPYFKDEAVYMYNLVNDNLGLGKEKVTNIREENGYSATVPPGVMKECYTDPYIFDSIKEDEYNHYVDECYVLSGSFGSGYTFSPNIHFENSAVDIFVLKIGSYGKNTSLLDHTRTYCMMNKENHLFYFYTTASSDSYFWPSWQSAYFMNSLDERNSGVLPISMNVKSDGEDGEISAIHFKFYEVSNTDAFLSGSESECLITSIKKVTVNTPIEINPFDINDYYTEATATISGRTTKKIVHLGSAIVKARIYTMKINGATKYLIVNGALGLTLVKNTEIKIKYLKNTNSEDPRIYYIYSNNQITVL